MELKNYQKAVIDSLEEYLKNLRDNSSKNPAKSAFIEITDKPSISLQRTCRMFLLSASKSQQAVGKHLLQAIVSARYMTITF
ncbi:MAG: hypothetical protein HZA08_06425 [Nitrospirae bacterium]|nr:hypothetical protein [Nitrospirota bacterium]